MTTQQVTPRKAVDLQQIAVPARTRSKQRRWHRDLATQTGVVAAALVLWHIFSLSEMAQKAGMPSPIESLTRFVELLGVSVFWQSIGATIISWSIALLLSLGVGIPLGMGIGRSRRAADSGRFLIDFLRTIPSLAIIPLALLLLGPTRGMVIMVATFSAVWPVLIQAIYAAEHSDPVLSRVARSFRLKWTDKVRYVLAPEFLAFFWPGVRMAVTASLLVTVGAELIGGAPGIGQAIQAALLVNQQASMFAYVIAAALLGLGINAVLMLVQRKLLWWHPSLRKDQ
ncbi:ABC transporter permease subunit [Glutamicibacter sp. MNS18]|uniref:ABC transporter permease n=1 Tax=Glutamicibacter sp. MNS18 TaxID=2989817 RepID=UPI0022363CC5|nr:ABC transporter permease subunit [Glutamicibacter sp. MNS18]MCW4466937.1 ABC transporter permease subunit [Glutamicibacter sp. MNS18]